GEIRAVEEPQLAASSYGMGAVVTSWVRCAVLLTALLACKDSLSPHSTVRTRVRNDWVTGAAAAALDSSTGLFRLQAPAPGFVSRALAESVAGAAARILGSTDPFSSARELLELERGA